VKGLALRWRSSTGPGCCCPRTHTRSLSASNSQVRYVDDTKDTRARSRTRSSVGVGAVGEVRRLEDYPEIVEREKDVSWGRGRRRRRRRRRRARVWRYHQSTGLPLSSRHEMPDAAAEVSARVARKSTAQRRNTGRSAVGDMLACVCAGDEGERRRRQRSKQGAKAAEAANGDVLSNGRCRGALSVEPTAGFLVCVVMEQNAPKKEENVGTGLG
jgi:hypothetical protein